MLAPQIYLACKHKKLHTLVTAITLQRLPITEAMSAFEIPQNEEAKLICQDPWVSIAVTPDHHTRYSCICIQSL